MAEGLLEQVVNGLMMGSIYVLVALGMVLIYGVMHVLNFAHGVLFAVGAYVCYFILSKVTGSYALAVVLSMAVLAVLGLALEHAVFRPLRGNLRNQVIASLGLILAIQNSVIWIWGPNALQMKIPATQSIVALGGALLGPLFLVFPTMGDQPLVKGLAGIILGGMGSVPGAVIGALAIGVVEAVSTLYFPTDYRDSVAFMVIVLVLLARPQGLFGVRVRGED